MLMVKKSHGFRARTRSLYMWFFMGTFTTFLLIFVSSCGILVAALLIFFFGASVGIGLPSCLSYYADSTVVENRGFVAGIIWSTVGFSVLFFAFLSNMLGQWETLLLLTLWRFLGGIGFILLNKNIRSIIIGKRALKAHKKLIL